MITSYFKCLLSLLFLSYPAALFAGQSQTPATKIILINHQNFERSNEVIAIKRNALGKVNASFFPIAKKGNASLISQLSDTDKDGTWDELLLEVNLKSLSHDTVLLIWVPKHEASTFESLTNIRFSLKSKTGITEEEIMNKERMRGFTQNIKDPTYQMEGPGIENDKVAFRFFFDKRNGKDVYGKLGAEPILDKVGLTGSWHKMQPWGMDILKTGNSLGAGSLAVLENNNLYSLADADKTIFTAIEEGPLSARFQLKFFNWDVGAGKRDGSETISITKGDFFYRNEVGLALQNKSYLVSGIANFDSLPANFKKHNSKFSSLSTFGPQAEGTKTQLGLALLFSTNNYALQATTNSSAPVPTTSYVALKPAHKLNTVYFFACWELTDKRFSNKDGFDNYLQQVADRLANPIEIKIK